MCGYTFRRQNSARGKSYWICCGANCSIRGTLLQDGTFRLRDLEHNHKPDLRKLKRQEELTRLKKLALRVNSPGYELLQTLDIKDDTRKNLDFIRIFRYRQKIRKQQNSERILGRRAGLNYELKSEKELICHSGFTYRKDSVDPRDMNCKYWKCTIESCKGRAKTDRGGNLTILNPIHNHPFEVIQKPLNREGQEPNSDSEKEIQVRQRRKSDRVSQKEGKIKLVSHNGVQNSTSCPDCDSFNLDKLMAATLDEDYCVTPEIDE